MIDKSNHCNNSTPPPLTLDDVTKSVLIVDKYGSWLHQWTDNFKALRIPHLRSLMSAHACPYDHRSLEYYAEVGALLFLLFLFLYDPSLSANHVLLWCKHSLMNVMSVSSTICNDRWKDGEMSWLRSEISIKEIKHSKGHIRWVLYSFCINCMYAVCMHISFLPFVFVGTINIHL